VYIIEDDMCSYFSTDRAPAAELACVHASDTQIDHGTCTSDGFSFATARNKYRIMREIKLETKSDKPKHRLIIRIAPTLVPLLAPPCGVVSDTWVQTCLRSSTYHFLPHPLAGALRAHAWCPRRPRSLPVSGVIQDLPRSTSGG
jgi:hypothetical protein